MNEDGELESFSDTYTSTEVTNVMTRPTYENMLDIAHGDRISYNPVIHNKVKFKGRGEPPDSKVIRYDYHDGGYYMFWKSFNAWHWGDPPEGVGPSPSVLTKFGNKVLTEAVDQFGEEVSIANALAELREASQLIVRDWALRLLTQKIGESYLSWQFGWKPLLSDIKKLLGVAKAVQKRLKHLKDTYGKPTTVHFNAGDRDDLTTFHTPGWPEDILLNPEDSPTARLLNMAGVVYVPVEATHTLVATCVLYHELQGLDEALAFAKGLENALGLDNLPKVLWNATPFSWMVEWFLNVARPLAAFEVQPFKGVIRILSVGYSVKSETTFDVVGGTVGWTSTLSRDHDCVVDRQTVGTLTATKYARYRGLPPSSWLFLEDNFTASQLAILLALLGANSR